MLVIRQDQAKTLTWWYSRRNNIDMSPSYQRRGGIWTKSDQSFLIDSILNGFDIPKIYMADFTFADSPLNKGKTQYAMIDGKQRFEAIFGFFDGTVLLDRTFVYRENPERSLSGLGYKDLKSLHPDVAEKFDNFNLSVMSVITKDEDEISELFVRLNRSKSLTGAEVRNAMPGPVPALIRDIAEHRFFTFNVRFDISRGADLNAAAKLLLTEFRGELVNVKKPDLDGLVEEAIRVEAPISDFEGAQRRTLMLLDQMAEVFVARDPLLRSQGPPIVYYWLVRHVHGEDLGIVRPFLVQFEDARQQNRSELRRNIRQDTQLFGLVRDLVEFDNFSRNTNDEASLQGRLRILLRWFTYWRLEWERTSHEERSDIRLTSIDERLNRENRENAAKQSNFP